MNINPIIALAALLLLLAACRNEAPRQEAETAPAVDLKQHLPGAWEAVSLQVTVHTAENTDSSYVFEVREENWVQRFGVHPKRTVFLLDNRFRTEFRSVTDTLIEAQRGVWNTFGDTLMLIEPSATTQYEVTLRSGLADWRTLVDWDGDGEVDDELWEVHRYVGRGTE